MWVADVASLHKVCPTIDRTSNSPQTVDMNFGGSKQRVRIEDLPLQPRAEFTLMQRTIRKVGMFGCGGTTSGVTRPNAARCTAATTNNPCVSKTSKPTTASCVRPVHGKPSQTFVYEMKELLHRSGSVGGGKRWDTPPNYTMISSTGAKPRTGSVFSGISKLAVRFEDLKATMASFDQCQEYDVHVEYERVHRSRPRALR